MRINKDKAIVVSARAILFIIAAGVLYLSAVYNQVLLYSKADPPAASRLSESLARMERARESRREAQFWRSIYEQSEGRLLEYQAREIARVIQAGCNSRISRPIVLAICWNESRWTPRAIGSQGEIGIMQIKPHIAAPHLKAMGLPAESMFDPSVNVSVGIAELKRLDALMGDVALAIVCYAGGPTKATEYARKVMKG